MSRGYRKSLVVRKSSLLTIVDIGTFTDPGFNDPVGGTSETISYQINWGDGTLPDTFRLFVDWADGQLDQFAYGASNRDFVVSHRYGDNRLNNVAYPVSVWVADDDTGESWPVQLSVQVNNLPPKAVDDAYEFEGTGTLVIGPRGVLANDSDPGMDTLTVSQWGTPSAGTLVQALPDGSFQYQAPANFSGTATFTYVADDGEGGVDSAVVSIEVGLHASISGYVYAVNSDSRFQPSQLGLPGVTVQLQAIDGRGVVEINTITDDAGYYHFDELRSGTYRVVEQQPAAVLPSGPDQLQVTVGANQASTGNNFSEGWLRPQYTSLRSLLVSTLVNGTQQLKEQLAKAEEAAGNLSKAAEIRLGETVQVARRGSSVEIMGTSLNDTFQFVPLDPTHGGWNAVTVNGQTYMFNPAEVTRFRFDGGNGQDRAAIFDTVGNDDLHGRYNVAEFVSDEFTADLVDFEWLQATSNRGGDDQLIAEHTIDYVLETVGDWNT